MRSTLTDALPTTPSMTRENDCMDVLAFDTAPYTETGKFLGSGLAAFLIALSLYVLVTRIKEVELIRAGNVAAAVSFAGAALGFVIPLAGVIDHSHDLTDMGIWSAITLVVQTVLYLAVRMVIPNLDAGIEKGNVADAILLATMSVSIGIILAVSLTLYPV